MASRIHHVPLPSENNIYDIPPQYEPQTSTLPANTSKHLSTHSKSVVEFPSSHVPPPRPLPLPCVLPQTSKTFRGAFHSPFIRAYAPALSSHGIDQTQFIAFIDGLNEAFVAHPVFGGASTIGVAMTMVHGVPPVQWAGAGLQFASGLASAGTSYLRTKAYITHMNADFFHPRGLHAGILPTPKMMAKIGHPEQTLRLPPLNDEADLHAAGSYDPGRGASPARMGGMNEDPRARRLRALENYVMPLNFDVPGQIEPDGLWKKMGAHQAASLSKKQEKKMAKTRQKGLDEYHEKCGEVEKVRAEGDREVAMLERKLAMERDKLAYITSSSSEHKRDKAMREFEKEEAKLHKEMEKEIRKRDEEVEKEMRKVGKGMAKMDRKESKTTNKIRWLVISNWEADGDEEVIDSDAEGEAPH